MKDVRDAQFIAKATDGTLVRRPLSPHLGIYRWEITMVSSILNRITGAGPAAFALVQEFLISPLGLLALLGWTAALFYHLFAGLRHLAWDIGIGFAKPSLNPVSWAVLAATVLATALVWAVAYMKLEG